MVTPICRRARSSVPPTLTPLFSKAEFCHQVLTGRDIPVGRKDTSWKMCLLMGQFRAS
jgi:hypothetical protein